MASLLSPRRGDSPIHLSATVPQAEEPEARPEEPQSAPLGWLIVALIGAVAAAGFGWVIVSGLAVVGWLAAEPGTLAGALRVGTQFWLLSNGAGAQLGTLQMTMVPLGMTAVFAVMINWFAAAAARQIDVETVRPVVAIARIVGVMTITYAIAVLAVAIAFGGPSSAVRGLVGGVLIALLSSAWGSCRSLDFHPTHLLPRWARSIPRAVAGAALVMVAAGSGTLVAGLVIHRDRIIELGSALQTGVAGGIALLALQLAFAPNAVIWSASYTLGAGFSLGDGSLISPTSTDIGMLPALPLLGALPGEGPGSDLYFLWLIAGVLAGTVAAFLAMRGRPTARFDEASLVGGLAGALSGLCLVGLGWLSAGDLGAGRLAHLGPALLPLLVMAVTLMGLAGLVTGLVFGLIRARRR